MGFGGQGVDLLGAVFTRKPLKTVEASFAAPFKADNPRDYLDRVTATSTARQLLIEPPRRASRAQKDAAALAAEAQRKNVAAARAQQRGEAEKARQANRRRPDIASILAYSGASGARGVQSTILSPLGGQRTNLGGK